MPEVGVHSLLESILPPLVVNTLANTNVEFIIVVGGMDFRAMLLSAEDEREA